MPLLDPIPRYTRIVDHYECPECRAVLEEYIDHVEYSRSGPLKAECTIRTFYPCGCTLVNEWDK